MPASSQVKLNFDQFNAHGLQNVVRVFAKKGYKVTVVDANNKNLSVSAALPLRALPWLLKMAKKWL